MDIISKDKRLAMLFISIKSYLVGLVKRYHASYADSVTTRYWTATPTWTKTLSFVFVSHKTSSCWTRSERRPTTDCRGQKMQLGPSLISFLNCPVIMYCAERRSVEASEFFRKKIDYSRPTSPKSSTTPTSFSRMH